MGNESFFRWSELNPLCLLLRLGKNFLLILMAGLIAVMLAAAALQTFHEDEYTTSATLAVNAKSSSGSAVLADLSASSEIASTFTQLFQSDMFRKLVSSSLETDTLPGTLSASVIPETNLLTLSVTAASPTDACRTLQLMLENYDTLSEHAFQNIILKELDSPTIPTAPSNPVNLMSICGKGFVLGAGLMIVMLLFFTIRSDTVQTTAAFRHKIDARLFAVLHHEAKNKTLKTKLKRANKGLLITMPAAGFLFTEEISRLSMTVEYAARKRGSKVLLVTSAAESEGKSTVAANLALSLAQSGKKVLLIDADLHKAAQFKLFGCQPKTELAAMLRGQAPAALERLPQHNLCAIFSTRTDKQAAELLASHRMTYLLEACRKNMDFIIIDTPPMLPFSDAEILADRADLSLLVVRQDAVPAAAINDMADALRQGRADFLGCVFNDVKSTPFSGSRPGYGYGGYGYGYGGYRRSRRKSQEQEEENGRA